MRFMLLVKASKESEAGVLPAEKILSEVVLYNEELAKAGALLAAEGLQASSKGARVHYANGKFRVIDGPFTESKELVAGFWLIQAKSRDEAIDWARRVPFDDGEVQIRPLFELPDFPLVPAEKTDGWREKEQQFRDAPPPARKPGTRRYLGMGMADKASEAGGPPDEELPAAKGGVFAERLQE